MTAPLPPRCYAAGFRGVRVSLSPRGVSLRRNENGLTMEKLSPFQPPRVIDVSGDETGFGNRTVSFPRFRRRHSIWNIEINSSAGHFLVSNESIPDEDGKLV